MSQRVVSFQAFVLAKQDGIVTVKVNKDLESIFIISEDDITNDVEVNPDIRVIISCIEKAKFTIETSSDAFREPQVEKYFQKIGDIKRAMVSFETFFNERAKLGTGTSPQAIGIGLKTEFI